MKVSDFVDMPAKVISDVSQVRESTLSKYFNGHRDPNYSSIYEMAKNLNMTPEEVLNGIRLRREKKILSKLGSQRPTA